MDTRVYVQASLRFFPPRQDPHTFGRPLVHTRLTDCMLVVSESEVRALQAALLDVLNEPEQVRTKV